MKLQLTLCKPKQMSHCFRAQGVTPTHLGDLLTPLHLKTFRTSISHFNFITVFWIWIWIEFLKPLKTLLVQVQNSEKFPSFQTSKILLHSFHYSTMNFFFVQQKPQNKNSYSSYKMMEIIRIKDDKEEYFIFIQKLPITAPFTHIFIIN